MSGYNRFQPKQRTIFDLDVKEVKVEPVMDRATGQPMEGKFSLSVVYNSGFWAAPYTQRYAGVTKNGETYEFTPNSESFRYTEKLKEIGIKNVFKNLVGKRIRCDKMKINRFSVTEKWFPMSVEKVE